MPPGAIVLSQTRQVEPQRTSEGPEPGFLDTLGAGTRTSMDAWSDTQALRRVEAYAELGDALVERGIAREQLMRQKGFLAQTFGSSDPAFDYSPELVWQAVEQARARDGKAFAGIPKTRDEFEQWVLRRKGARDVDQRTIARSSGVAAAAGGFIGQSAGDMADSDLGPLQFMFGGGGKTFAQVFLREGLVAAIEETAKQPERIANRKQLGEQTTATEAAVDIGTTFAFAGLLGVGGKYLGDNWDAIKAAPRDVQERAWAAILDRTPGLREKVGAKVDWGALDPHLADIAEATIPAARMTDAERGAINALRREAAIDAGNPFVPDGAGTESHYRLLGDALQGIINETPAYVPKVRPNPAARLRGGTSIASGVTGDAMQTVKARIGIVESGGSATARNPRSSAMGLYQFTDGTWLSYFKARFGSQGLTDAQIIARKADTGLQNTLMDDLLADNAKALQDAGFAADPGNLYLAHFAGRKGATKLLEADPATPAVRVLGEAVIEANPFLRGKSAGDVIAWAHGKMGQRAPTAAARGETADPLAALDRELADTQAEIARLDAEMAGGARGIDETLTDIAPEARPVVDAEPLARVDAPSPPPARIDTAVSATEVAGLTPEARAAIPELRRIVEGERGVSLNNPAALSARLGVDERNVQAALQQMAIDGLIVQGRSGKYARLPRRSDSRPMDVLEYVAATGGVTPKGFSQSIMAKLDTMENPPKGHDLGGIFEVAREVRWKRRPDPERGIEGIPLKKPRIDTRSRIIPGWGPIVRNSGRGIDEIGEDLFEAGYFPALGRRPTEAEVIDMLTAAAAGEKFYSINDAGRVADLEEAARASGYADPKNPFASDFQSEEHFDWEWRQFDSEADSAFGITLDEEAFINAWGEYRSAGDGDIRGAVLRAIQREIEDVQAREIAERGMADAADIIEEWEAALRADGFAGGGEIPAGRFDPGDPGPSGPPRGPAEWEEDGPLDPERWQAWDEPDGPAATIDTDSMEHDLRAQVEAAIEAQMERAKALEAVAPYGDTNVVTISVGGTTRLLDTTSPTAVQRVLGELSSSMEGEAFDQVMNFIEAAQKRNGKVGTGRNARKYSWLDTELAWSKIGDIEIRRGPWQALEVAKDMPFDEAKAFVEARDPLLQKPFSATKAITPADRAFYPEGYTGPALPDYAPTLDQLAPDTSADDMFAAMRDLPDTQDSQDMLAAARSRLWEQSSAEGNLDEAITRFDEARDRWDAQFEAAREAEGAARMEALQAEQAALATAIAEQVNSGRGVMRLLNPVRNTLAEYGPGTVRVRNGQLEVVEGRNWVAVPSSSLTEIAGRMGVKAEQSPTISTAPGGQAGEGPRLLYHGTRGERKAENPNGLGLTFFAEEERFAQRYAEGAGGRRANEGVPRIETIEAPPPETVLDITTREGLSVLSALSPQGRIGQIIVSDAKKDLADILQEGPRIGLRANTSFFGFTKSIAASDAAGFRADIVDALAEQGYRAIRFNDDQHVSVGVFDAPASPATPTITIAPDGQADFAAPTGAQVRTALERRTEGGIRPTGPQRAPGEDGGLFDTRDTTGDMLEPAPASPADLFDNMAFRLDEEGDVVNPADLLAEFDEDAAFIKTIKDCL